MFEVSGQVSCCEDHWGFRALLCFVGCNHLYVTLKAWLDCCLLFRGLQMLLLVFISPWPTLTVFFGMWPSTGIIKFVTEKWWLCKETDFESSSELDTLEISVLGIWYLEGVFLLLGSFILVFENICCLSNQCFQVAIQAGSNGSYPHKQ